LDFNELIHKEFLSDTQPTYLITPIHLADHNGIIYPWYGAIESSLQYGNFKSRNIFPMPTGNINDYYQLEGIEQDDDSSYQDETAYTSPDFASTCIGKYSSAQWTNLKHMNIMQTNSMYCNYIIPDNWVLDIYTAIQTSIDILESIIHPKGKSENE